SVETFREDARDAALRAEHRGARNAAAAAAAVLVTGCGGAELVAALHRLLVEPPEMTPRRPDLDQPLELRVMPIENAAAPTDVRNQQMAVRIVAIRGPQFLERPRTGLDRIGTLHVLVPFERAH